MGLIVKLALETKHEVTGNGSGVPISKSLAQLKDNHAEIETTLEDIRAWQAVHQASHKVVRQDWLEEMEENRQLRAQIIREVVGFDSRLRKLEGDEGTNQ